MSRATTPSPAAGFPAVDHRGALDVAYRWMQAACLTLILGVIAVFFHLGLAPYVAFAFAGAFLMHVASQPNLRDLGAVGACALLFAAGYYLLHGDWVYFYGAEIAVPGGFLGLGSVLVVALQWLWSPAAGRQASLERVTGVSLIPALCLCSMVAVNLAAGFTPITYDRILYVFDAKFLGTTAGGPPSWWIGVLAAVYLTLTALATLGFGEHYLADLMVAPPLGLAIQAACTRTESRVRWMALAAGAGMTLAWLIAFRTGAALAIPAGRATWSLALISVALPAMAGMRLERAVARESAPAGR
jgi:hypothetical protein